MIYFIFWKSSVLIKFFHFDFLNTDISLNIYFPMMTFCTDGHKILLEGRVSQISNFGLRFYFMYKNGKRFLNFWDSIFNI